MGQLREQAERVGFRRPRGYPFIGRPETSPGEGCNLSPSTASKFRTSIDVPHTGLDRGLIAPPRAQVPSTRAAVAQAQDRRDRLVEPQVPLRARGAPSRPPVASRLEPNPFGQTTGRTGVGGGTSTGSRRPSSPAHGDRRRRRGPGRAAPSAATIASSIDQRIRHFSSARPQPLLQGTSRATTQGQFQSLVRVDPA